MDKTLGLIGMMRKANAIAIGETATGNAARGGEAKLLILASDASQNARRRVEGFANSRKLRLLVLPYTKADISAATGKPGCSMAAVCDTGFANALLKLQEHKCETLEWEQEEAKRRNNA